MFHVFTFTATLLLAFFSQFNCDDFDSPSPRIFFGNDTTSALYTSDFQHIGEVIITGDPTCICFLIHPRFCLTSASCLTSRDGNPIDQLDVIFHLDKESDTETVIQGLSQSNIIYHGGYARGDKDHNNDIALLQFPSDVELPVLPLVKDGNLVDKRTCYASGWFIMNKHNKYPDILQNIQLPLLCSPTDMARCIAAWAAKTISITVDPVNMLCGGCYDETADKSDTFRGPCNGERGTALQCRTDKNDLVAVGILINTHDCNNDLVENRVPGVFLNIFQYLQWIDNAITLAYETSPGFYP